MEYRLTGNNNILNDGDVCKALLLPKPSVLAYLYQPVANLSSLFVTNCFFNLFPTSQS